MIMTLPSLNNHHLSNYPYPAAPPPPSNPSHSPNGGTSASFADPLAADRSYGLQVRQQPQHARVAVGKDKDRKPIDPPPILQLTVDRQRDPQQNFLQSPYFFMSCALVNADDDKEVTRTPLIGTLVSSLHKLKDTDNNDGGFFVFGDLSVKSEGKFRLLFSLYEMKEDSCTQLSTIKSDVFQVYAPKAFPGMAESTFLTRSFSDQGVRLRLRKDSRTMTTRKRNSAAAQLSDVVYRGAPRPRASYDGNLGQRQGIHDSSQSPQLDTPTPRSSTFNGQYYEPRLVDSREASQSVQTPQSAHSQQYYFPPNPYPVNGMQQTHPHHAPMAHSVHIPQVTMAPGMSHYMAHDPTGQYPPTAAPGQAPQHLSPIDMGNRSRIPASDAPRGPPGGPQAN